MFQILFRENEDYSYTGGSSASLLSLNLGRDEYSHEQLGCLSLHFSILVNSFFLSLSQLLAIALCCSIDFTNGVKVLEFKSIGCCDLI